MWYQRNANFNNHQKHDICKHYGHHRSINSYEVEPNLLYGFALNMKDMYKKQSQMQSLGCGHT